MSSNTKTKAQNEFNILEKTTKDAIILPFKKEILALLDKFGKSGQSGFSAPYTAEAISSAVKKLCLQEPIGPITGKNFEWNNCIPISEEKKMYQNNRCSAVFKNGKKGKAYYIDAIIFEGSEGGSFTSNGSVELKDGTIIRSKQFIKEFPFNPKKFYIKVIDHRFDKDKTTGKLTLNKEGDWWEHTLEDETQLKEVFEYYDFYEE